VRDDREAVKGGFAASGRKWIVVIPVKPAPEGKSRLLLPPTGRLAIVRAIALDTIEAAADCDQVERVLVVTADRPLALALTARDRVTVVHDSASGLREAIDLGLSAADAGAPRAVLLGDLPALKPRELSSALTLSARHPRAFVPDADGIGSVLATALPGVFFRPQFGANSAAAHRNEGYAEVELPATSGLRRDLDKAEHLPILRRLGLGRHTAALLG
jgi:2-phospho-L-lactate guanylyltransferase